MHAAWMIKVVKPAQAGAAASGTNVEIPLVLFHYRAV